MRVTGYRPNKSSVPCLKTEFNDLKTPPALEILPEPIFVYVGPCKPVAVNDSIGHDPIRTSGPSAQEPDADALLGRRRIAAFGNSDGDLPLLEWTAGGERERMMVMIHHDDARREFQYDDDAHAILEEVRRHSLESGNASGPKRWLIAEMSDWRPLYSPGVVRCRCASPNRHTGGTLSNAGYCGTRLYLSLRSTPRNFVVTIELFVQHLGGATTKERRIVVGSEPDSLVVILDRPVVLPGLSYEEPR